MSGQQFFQFIAAPPGVVYRALLDPRLIERWRVPTGMHATVHEFEPRVGGRFRVSLTYESPGQSGKTTATTDTYRGTFRELVPDALVVETLEFETTDPNMQGQMCITTELEASEQGTLLVATHEGLPPGLSLRDNELGWRDSLGKLAELLVSPEGAP
ncbi:MAG TPA: SRPBCC domain-containing protein [Terriglobia bacterium]|nr:SRPBCC domain-containing protein [Terriglobia bacterium]